MKNCRISLGKSTTCVYQAVVDYNCVGEVAILGYYDTDTILKAKRKCSQCNDLDRHTEQMGACVDALRDYRLAIPVSILRRMSRLFRITWVNIYKRRKRQSEVRMRKKFRQLSLQAKMSSIFVLANLVVFAVTVILLLGINSMSSEIDKVYQGICG